MPFKSVLLFLAAVSLLLQNAPAGVVRMVVDKKPVPVDFTRDADEYEVPVPSNGVEIFFESNSDGPQVDVRYRYKLEGSDLEWRASRGEMRMFVIFYDEKEKWVGQKEFWFEGVTPGWTGSAEGSRLVPRREMVEIPAKAAKFCVVFTSSGSPSVLGTLAIGALKVTRLKDKAAGTGDPLMELAFSEDDNTEPVHWGRSGDWPIAARILHCESSPSKHLLAILDDFVNGHAEWRSAKFPLNAAPGQFLRLDLMLSYNVGELGRHVVAYRNLKPGRYLFRVAELTALGGRPNGVEKIYALNVYGLFWQRPWFLVMSGMTVAGMVLGVVRYVGWQRTQREIARLREQNALEAERARIARDIHDDLGSSLTHITMLSHGLTPENISFEESLENLAQINQTAGEMTRSMDEIVWALNPRNDQLERLVTFLASYAQEFLSSAGIECRCDYPEKLPDIAFPASKRHNLFLAFKEALTNATRHSQCRTLRILISIEEGILSVTLEDDGKGFDSSGESSIGNGLNNMRQRMEQLEGRFQMESSPAGTKIVFAMPVTG